MPKEAHAEIDEADRVFAHAHAQAGGRDLRGNRASANVTFNRFDDRGRLLRPPVDEQPARALRQNTAEQQDAKAERGADAEGEPPSEVGRKSPRLEQDCRPERTCQRAQPEAAVDREISATAVMHRNQFLQCRVDRGVFPADAGAGDEAEQREHREVGRERAGGGGGDVDAERDKEQPLAAEAIGQPAEKESAKHRAGEIRACRGADLRVGQMQRRARLQCTGHRTGQRHLEPVEHPGDPERSHRDRVEASPRQSVQACRDVGFEDRYRVSMC